MKKPATMMLFILGVLLFFPLMSGAQWVQTGGPKTDWVSALAVIGTNLFAGTGEGVFLSTDDGATWAPVNNGFFGCKDVRCLAAIGTNLFAGTEGIGVWRMPLSKMPLKKR